MKKEDKIDILCNDVMELKLQKILNPGLDKTQKEINKEEPKTEIEVENVIALSLIYTLATLKSQFISFYCKNFLSVTLH